MNSLSHSLPLVPPVVYQLIVLALCAYLLIRGIAHAFVVLFAAGALIGLIRNMGFLAISAAPGGFSGNTHYLSLLGGLGYFGMLVFLAAFFSMTLFLLRPPVPQG